jgi:hypothetical protein
MSKLADCDQFAPSKSEDALLNRDFRKSDLEDVLDLLPKCFAQEFEILGASTPLTLETS